MEEASQEKLDNFLEIFEKIKQPDTSIFLFRLPNQISQNEMTQPSYFYIGMHRLINNLVLNKVLKTLKNSEKGSVNAFFKNIPKFKMPAIKKMKQLTYQVPGTTGYFAFRNEQQAENLFKAFRGKNPIRVDTTEGLHYYGHHAGNKDAVNKTLFLAVSRKPFKLIPKENEEQWNKAHRPEFQNKLVKFFFIEDARCVPGLVRTKAKFNNKKLIGFDLEFIDFLHADYFHTFAEKILPSSSGELFDKSILTVRPIWSVWKSPNRRLQKGTGYAPKVDLDEMSQAGTAFV